MIMLYNYDINMLTRLVPNFNASVSSIIPLSVFVLISEKIFFVVLKMETSGFFFLLFKLPNNVQMLFGI